jgi:hypothetical protein
MTECLVDRELDWDNAITPIKEKIVVTRRVMQCVECGATMLAGQKFWIETGRMDDGYQFNITCLPCREIRERFCCSFIYGSVLQDIGEELYELDGELELGCVDGLSRDAIEKISDIADDVWAQLERIKSGCLEVPE